MENGYWSGIYPLLSRFQRLLTGWCPVSIGDLLYALAAGLALVALGRLIRRSLRGGVTRRGLARGLLKVVLVIYCWFNLFWGINYDRPGVARQLGLRADRYGQEELTRLTLRLGGWLNREAARLGSGPLPDRPVEQYAAAALLSFRGGSRSFPWMHYPFPSVKRSLFTPLARYGGFTGYYNPFTGEAQLQTAVPLFARPFVVHHEIAHALGYARENEASFVAYLAARHTTDPEVRYSVAFELFWDALRGLERMRGAPSPAIRGALHPRVHRDRAEWEEYLKRTRNVVEPYITRMYDRFLKWNNQPLGVGTYDEVIALVLAYEK